MDDSIDAALREIESLLAGLNYVVYLNSQHVPKIPGDAPGDYINYAFGSEPVVSNLWPVGSVERLERVERCLRYAGDTSSGPPIAALRSPRLTELIDRLDQHIRELFRSSTSVVEVEFSGNFGKHPLESMPAYWDFCFVFIDLRGAEILVGLASD
jgi:hypothetical protein